MELVQFDWAIKKLLRHKANFGILEGFLTELLKLDVTILEILESESNQEVPKDKFNRVDILVKSKQNELMLVEVQNEPEVDYFHRMLYGASKLITQYIKQGDSYGKIKKVFSINIVYFGLGQGHDYVYEYRGGFYGIHNHERLTPSIHQKQTFDIQHVADIFPKYYILKINNFDDVAKDTLDEWIYFLKNSEIKPNFRAKGLPEAAEKLQVLAMSEHERKIYERHQDNLRIEKAVKETARMEGMDESKKNIAKNAIEEGLEISLIQKLTGLSVEEIEKIKENLDTINKDNA